MEWRGKQEALRLPALPPYSSLSPSACSFLLHHWDSTSLILFKICLASFYLILSHIPHVFLSVLWPRASKSIGNSLLLLFLQRRETYMKEKNGKRWKTGDDNILKLSLLLCLYILKERGEEENKEQGLDGDCLLWRKFYTCIYIFVCTCVHFHFATCMPPLPPSLPAMPSASLPCLPACLHHLFPSLPPCSFLPPSGWVIPSLPCSTRPLSLWIGFGTQPSRGQTCRQGHPAWKH